VSIVVKGILDDPVSGKPSEEEAQFRMGQLGLSQERVDGDTEEYSVLLGRGRG